MKSLKNLFGKTKRGATSIYIVVFATILFGVVTLSFIRIMLSEASQSSDDDLSQSAYDSAMAGVEDAKIAVNAYYKCLSEHKDNSSYCENLRTIGANPITEHPDDPKCENDFVLGEILHGVGDGKEVPIISTNDNINGETDSSDQAYTCVIISDVTPDYRGTLTSDTRTKVIPISVPRNGVTTSYKSAKLDEVAFIDFSWYSELNRGNLQKGSYQVSPNKVFKNATNATVPPTIQLTFIKVAEGHLNLDELRAANSTVDVVNSTMVLLPAYNDGGSNVPIPSNRILEYGQITKTDDPIDVHCGDAEFACEVRLDVSGLNLREGDNVFLVASLPYGDPMSDFAVTLRRNDPEESVVKFHGVQISVDSTGRTNQLFRRVETRLDPADLFFPYPQYAIELGGGDGESLSKKFWITANCWYQQPDNGGYCANNGNVTL